MTNCAVAPSRAHCCASSAKLARITIARATMAASDFSRLCIVGYGCSPSRCRPAAAAERSIARSPVPAQGASAMPGSLTTPGHLSARADATECVAFHHLHGVGIQNRKLSRLNGWPTRPPVNASPRPSRATAHDSGPMWFGRVGPRRGPGFEMPTSPRCPLSFRTAGFPRYGWKAGLSGPSQYIGQLKPAPGMRWSVSGLRPSFVRLVTSAMAPL